MSAANAFQVAFEFINARLSYAICAGPRKYAGGPYTSSLPSPFGSR
jgi:hypothetical protein